MPYTATCEICEDQVDDAFLMAQFHEEEFMTNDAGDLLKEAGYSLQDTVTFCQACTLELLLE